VKLTGLAKSWLPLQVPWDSLQQFHEAASRGASASASTTAAAAGLGSVLVTAGYSPSHMSDGVNESGEVEFAALEDGVPLAVATAALVRKRRVFSPLFSVSI
jgi:ABC-type Fe3+ transport system substrate-binding protein